jgi:aspartyl-tRNA(Asn)/glutamyl-tRNA(Gln) amidotransferase subunit A
LKGLRLGVPRQYFFDNLQPDVRRNTLAAISLMEENGAQVREVSLRHMNATADLAGQITLAEALLYHSKWIQKRAEDYGSDLRIRLKEGMQISALSYLLARKLREEYAHGFQDALQSVDLIVAPTLPVAAPCLAEKEVHTGRGKENVRMALLRLTRPANLTGLPAISLPCGFTHNGLPTGLQLIGRTMEEKIILRAAYAYEEMTPWHTKHPAHYE